MPTNEGNQDTLLSIFVQSVFFAQDKLFEGWYEITMLRFLLAEFFISEMWSAKKYTKRNSRGSDWVESPFWCL